jgi:hypothetical protein
MLAVLVTPAMAFVPVPVVDVGEEGLARGPIEHVANLPYADAYGTGPNQGTDLEFATIPVARTIEERTGRGRGGGAVRTRTVTEERTFAFAGSYMNGLQIVDVSDPGSPALVGVYDCAIAQGDVQVFGRDGRWYVTYTRDTFYDAETDSACFLEAETLGFGARDELGPGTFVVDVTDPAVPTTVSFVSFPKGSHNQTVHPSGDYLYNSNSELITSVVGEVGIEVVDISDLSAPEQVAFVALPIRPGLGTESHDVTFSADGTRAYSAALSQTVIIDTTDPADPSIISSFVDPAINVEHQADPVTLTDPLLGTRDFLVIEDEVAGATPTGQCPNGGVHVYDITGDLEQSPVKVGYWNISDVGPTTDGLGTCTAHVFEIHEDEALMTIAYYNGGVRVVDLSGLVGVALGEVGVGMRELASFRFADSDTWAVKAPHVSRDEPFHVYGNDIARGLDVYRVDLTQPTAGAGTGLDVWLSAEAAATELETGLRPDDDSYELGLRCKLPPAA